MAILVMLSYYLRIDTVRDEQLMALFHTRHNHLLRSIQAIIPNTLRRSDQLTTNALCFVCDAVYTYTNL
jgi:hypothetical protein